MTDNEIIKALECCVSGYMNKNCDDCPMQRESECMEVLPAKALDVINRQKAEIAKLYRVIAYKDYSFAEVTAALRLAKELLETEKSEAIKEFAQIEWRKRKWNGLKYVGNADIYLQHR